MDRIGTPIIVDSIYTGVNHHQSGMRCLNDYLFNRAVTGTLLSRLGKKKLLFTHRDNNVSRMTRLNPKP